MNENAVALAPTRSRSGADTGRAAIRAGPPAVGDHAELGGQHHLIAAPLQGPAHEFLVDIRPVHLGSVDQGDTQIDGPVDGADGFGIVAIGAAVGERHAHGAQADPGDAEVAELCVFHGAPLRGGRHLNRQ
jgi:hypothetical protein